MSPGKILYTNKTEHYHPINTSIQNIYYSIQIFDIYIDNFLLFQDC